MFCPKCGNEVAEGSAFCGKCGAPVGGPAAAAETSGAAAGGLKPAPTGAPAVLGPVHLLLRRAARRSASLWLRPWS